MGQFLIDKIDDTVLFTFVGNAIAKLGIPEKQIVSVLNVLEQAKPEGGYVGKLRDPKFREDLRSFIALFQREKEQSLLTEDISAKPSVINPNIL